MSYEAFKVEALEEGTIVKVTICRPKALNAMNPAFFEELPRIFTAINQNPIAKVVILVGDGRGFSSGLDLKEYGSMFSFNESQDPSRNSIKCYNAVRKMQYQFLTVMQCRVPVLVGVHNFCIGGGIDLICLTDIRYCTKDAAFSIKEIDIGMAADLGTLQLFPNIMGNNSSFRELAYTGRIMNCEEAKEIGLVSKIFKDKTEMETGLLATAKQIASKSPVAIYTLKHIMRREMYKKVQESLQYMARTNSGMLLTKDTTTAITAFLMKKKPEFGNL